MTTATYEESCEKLFSSLKLYEGGDQLHSALVSFVHGPSVPSAQAVYDAFLSTYRMRGLELLLQSIRAYEEGAGPLLPRHRDHYVHSVFVFLLGISVYANNSRYRGVASDCLNYPDAYPLTEEFLYRWGLTSLFHDLGYPLELSVRLMNNYSATVTAPSLVVSNGVVEYVPSNSTSGPVFTLDLADLGALIRLAPLPPAEDKAEEFYTKHPALKMLQVPTAFHAIAWNIAERLSLGSTPELLSTIDRSFHDGLAKGKVDHAIVGATVFLRWMNEFYSKTGWNPAYFYYPAVDAAAAIYLHNTLEFTYSTASPVLSPISAQQHPMAFLLYLCDHLQETDRTVFGAGERRVELELSRLEITEQALTVGIDRGKHPDQEEVMRLPSKIKRSLDLGLVVDSVFSEVEINV